MPRFQTRFIQDNLSRRIQRPSKTEVIKKVKSIESEEKMAASASMSQQAVSRFRPLADRILVQVVKPINKTQGGVILPDAAKTSTNQAMVIACGPGRLTRDGSKKIPITINSRDTVIIPEYGGMALKFDGEDYKIFREDDIVGVVQEA